MTHTQETADYCDARANEVEAEMPEFARILREATAMLRSWED